MEIVWWQRREEEQKEDEEEGMDQLLVVATQHLLKRPGLPSIPSSQALVSLSHSLSFLSVVCVVLCHPISVDLTEVH